MGIVTLTDWKDNLSEENSQRPYAWVFSTQVPALEFGCNTFAKRESKWIAFIDTDEFLVPVQVDSILDILKKYDDEVGLAISWKVFGTSNVKTIEKNQLMIELLIKCTTPENGLNVLVKSIAKTEKFLKFDQAAPHYCNYIDARHSLHLQKEEIVINHYMNRNEDYFYKNKVKNREKTSNQKMSATKILQEIKVGNDMEDEKKHIFRFIPELRKKMGFEKGE